MWLDSALTLRESRWRSINLARQAEARVRRLTIRHGVPPSSARNLQMAIIQGTMLYASELTWRGQRGMEGEHQAAINRMRRATLGAFKTTPLGTVAVESALTPARAPLGHRHPAIPGQTGGGERRRSWGDGLRWRAGYGRQRVWGRRGLWRGGVGLNAVFSGQDIRREGGGGPGNRIQLEGQRPLV